MLISVVNRGLKTLISDEAAIALNVKTPYRTPLLVSAIVMEVGLPPPAPRPWNKAVSVDIQIYLKFEQRAYTDGLVKAWVAEQTHREEKDLYERTWYSLDINSEMLLESESRSDLSSLISSPHGQLFWLSCPIIRHRGIRIHSWNRRIDLHTLWIGLGIEEVDLVSLPKVDLHEQKE